MKKKFFLVLLIGLCTIAQSVKAEVEFSYEAGAELVSAYLWRGLYNGGLSLQPTVTVGYESDNTSLSVGAWGSIGASDWKFAKEKDGAAGTRFVPEIDLVASFSFYGVTVGATHYYYFGGSNFFCWNKNWTEEMLEKNTSTTEVQVGYSLEHTLDLPLYVNWYTMVAGNDFNEQEDGTMKRAFSSYLELGYDHTFDAIGLTIGAQIGFSPWASPVYGNEKFAVKCLSLRLEKEWEFDHCSLNLFGQGMLDCDGITKDNVYVNLAGDDKLYMQKLNGTIGLGVWF